VIDQKQWFEGMTSCEDGIPIKPPPEIEKRITQHEKLFAEYQPEIEISLVFPIAEQEKYLEIAEWFEKDPRRLVIPESENWYCVDLQGRVLAGAKIQGSITSSNLKGIDFTGSDLENADFSLSYMWASKLTHANLTNADLHFTQLSKSNLDGAILKESDISLSDLTDTSAIKVNFTGANLEESILTGADIIKSDFRGSNLARVTLSGTDLSSSNFSGLNLADMLSRKYIPASVKGVNFSSANLQGFDFIGTWLTDVKFTNADLRDANFENHIFTRTDFSYACVSNAVFTDSKIQHALGIDTVLFDDPKEQCSEFSSKNFKNSTDKTFEELLPTDFYSFAKSLREDGYIEQAKKSYIRIPTQ